MVNCLYIHIPFCIKKCGYCDFYSVPFGPQIAVDYIGALRSEMEMKRELGHDISTVFIGGGTPSILSCDQISIIMEAVRDNFSMTTDAEVTIEANPGTVTAQRCEGLLNAGINRISIGIQSFSDRELALLGRVHNATGGVEAVQAAGRAGFGNISLDLIYGIPGQTLSDWEYNLNKFLELSPQHISAYELTPEKNTPLCGDLESGELVMPDEETIAEMYYRGINVLNGHGYLHYEISNFAKPGHECLHNLNYWNRGQYIGLGASAHSFYDRRRIANVSDVSGYIKTVNAGSIPVVEDTEITPDEAIKESVFLGLRKTSGMEMDLIPEGKRALIIEAVKGPDLHGFVEIKDNCLRLTGKGLILCNEVILRIFDLL